MPAASPHPADGRQIAFVGLGTMAGQMAAHPLASGWEVTGYNRTAARAAPLAQQGLRQCDTPRQAAAAAALVVISMFDDNALRSVADGPDGFVAGVRPGTVVVETSTVRAETGAWLKDAVGERGGRYLAAPVSGNATVAAAGELTFLCSGDRVAFDAAQPFFALAGRSAIFLGSEEQARAAKLAINLVLAGTMQLIAEALRIGAGEGLSGEALLRALSASVVGSRFIEYKTGPLLADDYTPTFSVLGMIKDVALARAAAGDADLPIADTVAIQLDRCVSHGWGELDFAALVRLLRPSSLGEG
jgi:3-hydroxyisobutyrate dehydrogenase-like beta-hydroxyacid dehydrogenase